MINCASIVAIVALLSFSSLRICHAADSTLVHLAKKGSIALNGLVLTSVTKDSNSFNHTRDTSYTQIIKHGLSESWGLYSITSSETADTLIIEGTPDTPANYAYLHARLVIDTLKQQLSEITMTISTRSIYTGNRIDYSQNVSITNVPYTIGSDGSLSVHFAGPLFFHHGFTYSSSFDHAQYQNNTTSNHHVDYVAPFDSSSAPTIDLHLNNIAARVLLVGGVTSQYAYPNPCNQRVFVRSTTSLSPAVYDSFGRLRDVPVGRRGCEIALNVSSLEPGGYWVRESGGATTHFVVLR